MGKRGRFGKYGEVKRLARLRKGRADSVFSTRGEVKALRDATHFKKKASCIDRVTTRLARTSDEDYIRSLSERAFHQYGSYDKMLSHWLVSGTTVTLLALMNKGPVGFAMLGCSAYKGYSAPFYELLAIAVEPEMHRIGIGDLLMSDILRKAEELQVEILILHTATENLSGQRLFKKHGFASSEIKKNFYPEGQDALMMYKDML
jgi:ribosomal-protein-alanine N-acetyltransferase